tara:strand:- start:756 stop:1712 length:957 start_codon:yes stop_codon:yes gene_type:complete
MATPDKPAALVALEQAFAAANGGGNGYGFVSAPMAISALLDLLDGGSHLVLSEGAHPDTYRMIESVRRRSAGLKVSVADMADLVALEQAVTADTRMLWVEAVAGPRLSRADLARVAAFARARDILVLVDNSGLGHAARKPLADGCDAVFISAPPRAARGGLVTFSESAGFVEDRFAYLQNAYDAMPDPEQAEALLLALQALPDELAARATAASALASFLTEWGAVTEIFHPGEDCPDLSVTLDGRADDINAALGRLSRFRPGSVPGQPGSYWHYARRNYEAVPEDIRLALGIPDGLVRFGIPAEDPADLIRDFQTAFG